MAVTHGDDHAQSEDDPFAGLVLDESFVQAAKVSEAPARTREAIAKYAHLEQPVLGTGRSPERTPRSRKKRRWITVTAVSTVAALLGYVVWLTSRPSHTAGPVAPLTNAIPSPEQTSPSSPRALQPIPDPTVWGYVQGSQVGECLTWNDGTDVNVRTVDCSTPHRVQVTGKLNLVDHFHSDQWPGTPAIDAVGTQLCTPDFERFTGLRGPRENGYEAADLSPEQPAWDAGDRTLVCTVRRYDTKPFRGTAEDLRPPVST